MTKKQRKKHLAWVANRREKQQITTFAPPETKPEPRGFLSQFLNLFRRST